MQDQRLTVENVKLALDKLGCKPGEARLYFGQALILQAGEVGAQVGLEGGHLTLREWYDLEWTVGRNGNHIGFCGNACAHVEPYGWVPEAGCPIHDGDD